VNAFERIGALLSALAAGCATLHTPVHDGRASDYFDGRRFVNTAPVERHSWRDLWRWMRTREPGPWSAYREVPCAPPPQASAGPGTLRVTWVNHSTVLIQAAGRNFLTDPIWSARASPVPFAGPHRVRPPGVCFEDLPAIHGVLLSHNHYDHMDTPTLRRLRAAHDPVVYAPLGHRRLLGRAGIVRVRELDWWEGLDLGEGLHLTAVPARHWSARGLFDRNRAHWGGFFLRTPTGGMYFAGDTGMAGHFAEIRARLGAPRVALLPIGAYLPRWFMREVHLSPPEAVAAHRLLGAEVGIAIHHATFRLGDDGQTQAAQELAAARQAAGLDPGAFRILDFGEALELHAQTPRTAAEPRLPARLNAR
jgi:L-ascorbate metabolism protein UlaG (beta-lactamase superfamily)